MKNFFFIECDGTYADAFRGVYPDMARAICEADTEWRHLTNREQKAQALSVYSFSAPDDVQLDEAMDYMYDNDAEYNLLLTFSDSQRWEVCANSAEVAERLDSVIPPLPFGDGLMLTVCAASED